MELLQTDLIDRVISALGLKGANQNSTSVEKGALGSDKDIDLANGTFNYASAIVMTMYLARKSRPDIAFAVHQCARWTHSPKLSHEIALKRIGRYLIRTRTKGLIVELDPSRAIETTCYVDADFSGLWGVEDPQDPAGVKGENLLSLYGMKHSSNLG